MQNTLKNWKPMLVNVAFIALITAAGVHTLEHFEGMEKGAGAYCEQHGLELGGATEAYSCVFPNNGSHAFTIHYHGKTGWQKGEPPCYGIGCAAAVFPWWVSAASVVFAAIIVFLAVTVGQRPSSRGGNAS